jgi:biotin carboxyl carrier protein
MKMRVQVEGRAYEVEVDLMETPVTASVIEVPDVEGAPVVQTPIPEAVLSPRPPQKLPEDSECRSPIAGRVTAVLVEVGGTVRKNEPVILIDAMKMEVPIGPVVDGSVKAIHVGPGDSVKAGQLLFELV